MDEKLYNVVLKGDCGSLVGLINNPEILKQTTPAGDSALHLAARKGHAEMVRKLIELEPCTLSMQNKKGETALHKAAGAGHGNVVDCLLDFKSDARETVDLEACPPTFQIFVNGDNETALHSAARGGHVKVVETLLKKVKGIESVVNKAGESALYTACDLDRFKVAKLLLDHRPSVADSTADGRTCLHVAIRSKKEVLALELLKQREELALKADISNNMPLHLAIFCGCLQTAKKLLSIARQSSFHHNNEEMYPIHIAAQVGCQDSVKLLMESTPYCIQLPGKHNKNALHFATENGGQWQVQKCLLKNAPDPASLISQPDDEGKTPLEIARECKEYKAIEMMLKMSNCTENVEIRKRNSFKEIEEKGSGAICKCGKAIVRDNSIKDSKETLSIIAILIATVTFTGVFQIPGGVSTEQGIPVRMHSAALKVFIISNSVAMCYSMLALMLLVDVRYVCQAFAKDKSFKFLSKNFCYDCKQRQLYNPVYETASDFVSCAFVATMVSYSTCLYILVAPRYLVLWVITCALGGSIALFQTLLLVRYGQPFKRTFLLVIFVLKFVWTDIMSNFFHRHS